MEVPPFVEPALDTVISAVPTAVRSLAGTTAVRSAASTNFVANGEPFHSTTETPVIKPVPVTPSVNAALPSVADAGAFDGKRSIAVIVGATAVTWKFTGVEVPPPGPAVTTITGKLPGVANKLAPTVAVSSVDETYTVLRGTVVGGVTPAGVLVHSIVDPWTKPVPRTVNATCAVPSLAVLGFSDVMVGNGFITENVTKPLD